MRRARATRHNEPYEPEDVTELIVEARKAFAWHLPEDRRNLTDLKDLLDRVRAQNDAIIALCGRVRDAARK
ncbi:MAG: hypothetical protein DMF88_27105 [Acidobacteria bacterium]|nr:MAG: hypothetical protein DMF88_27105 [Acidobacteriota bacterium]